MNINPVNTTNFKSQIIPNKYLAISIDEGIKRNDMQFCKSLKNILNDGKDRVVSVSVLFNNGKYDMTNLMISDRNGGYWAKSKLNNEISQLKLICQDIISCINNFSAKELHSDSKDESISKKILTEELTKIKHQIFK